MLEQRIRGKWSSGDEDAGGKGQGGQSKVISKPFKSFVEGF